jgi:small-conductance mechanosensitive channel
LIWIDLAPLLATAGVIGIAIGFGAQSLVKDFFSGIFVLLEDQYRVGDVVRIGNIAGQVEDINLRRTLLRDLDFIVHTIPNGEVRIASNFTKEESRVNLNISVAYKEDLDEVIDLINRVGRGMSEDPYFGTLIRDPLQVLRVDAFEESGIAIKVLGETLPIRQWEVGGEFRRRIKRAFDEQGIEIPFPHRTVYWGAGVETRVRQLVENANLDKDSKADEELPYQTKDEGRRTTDG